MQGAVYSKEGFNQNGVWQVYFANAQVSETANNRIENGEVSECEFYIVKEEN